MPLTGLVLEHQLGRWLQMAVAFVRLAFTRLIVAVDKLVDRGELANIPSREERLAKRIGNATCALATA